MPAKIQGELTNQDRAAWAQEALEKFAVKMGEEVFVDAPEAESGQVVDDAAVVDFLADLMHFCRQHSVDFESALRMARDHFEAEVEEEATLESEGPGR